MSFRLLLDTHILVRWLIEPRRLSREQSRVIEGALRHGEPVAISAITLLEIAMLESEGQLRLNASASEFLETLADNHAIRLLPLTYEVAKEAVALRSLRDPADRTIVGTALAHRLQLVTSDQRIIGSQLVAVIE